MQNLSKQFKQQNPLDKRSPAAIVHFRIESNADAALQDALKQELGSEAYEKRMAPILEERSRIAALDFGEALVSLLRKQFYPENLSAICDRANTLGGEAMAAILRRLKTSYQDIYIESAIYVLAKADPQYAKQLLADYADIRNPYAKSLACLLFGMQKLEESDALLQKEYEAMRKHTDDPALCQGPLLGLYILHDQAE